MEKEEFKVGDIVYAGTIKGVVKEIANNEKLIRVDFEDELISWFTKQGSYYECHPIVLKKYPYEIEYKEIIPVIEKDTPVYMKFENSNEWQIRYYSNYDYNSKKHFVFSNQKKSTENLNIVAVQEISLTNPLL